MRQVSIYGLLAIGMTFVILTAGIDLSVGSLVALAGLVAAAVAKGGIANRFISSARAGRARLWLGSRPARRRSSVGLAGGFLQGFAITRLKVPPFVVTLGGMSVFRGAALLFAGGGPISGFDADLRLVGAGPGRAGAGPGDHLPRLRAARPHRAALHALRPPGLCGRRQSARRRGCPASTCRRVILPASMSSWASSPGSAPSSCRRG